MKLKLVLKITIITLAGLFVIFLIIGGIASESDSKADIAHMDNVASIVLPGFIKTPHGPDVTADPISHSNTYINYYWRGKEYSDFEGDSNATQWHLIVTIYEGRENISSLASYLKDSAVGYCYDTGNPRRSVSGLAYSYYKDIPAGSMETNPFDGLIFSPILASSTDGIDIQTSEYISNLPHTFSTDTTSSQTRIVLITDRNRAVRLLLSVPFDSLSETDIITLARKTLSSISIDKNSLSDYFKELHNETVHHT